VIPVETWTIDQFTVTDGDTIRVFRSMERHAREPVPLGDFIHEELERTRTNPATHPRGESVRLVTLDTPETGKPGWASARAELSVWLEARRGRLMVDIYPKEPQGGMGRLLGDVWTVGDRQDTATQFMLRRGWEPWVE
jgi:endonuclease YncB( thermonuclease family)